MTATRLFCALLVSSAITAAPAVAVDFGVPGKKLVIKTNHITGKSTLKSIQSSSAAVGTGSAANIEGSLQVLWSGTGNQGVLNMPSPWGSNTGLKTKYKNASAPAGPSQVKTAVLTATKNAVVTAKGLGGLDLTTIPPVAGIIVMLTVENGDLGQTTRMCTLYSEASGSSISHSTNAIASKLTAKNGVSTTCPALCDDGIQNGTESDVDCGGSCGGCGTGDSCNGNGDCLAGNCVGNVCVAPSCTDGLQNQDETCVDGGGSCPNNCGLGGGCVTSGDCNTNLSCIGSVCKCNNFAFTFTVNSNSGGAFDSAEWPGGTASQSSATGCSVTINRPNANIDQVCAIASPFSVNTFSGFSNCFGTGGEDGDGCQTISCPPVGVGSCCSGRPSCSAALNGSATAQYYVQCLQ